MEAEKRLCFTNRKLEIAYFEHGFDDIVEKDLEERGLTPRDRTHHRGSVIEANMWMVYKQVSRREGHEAGMAILREKLEHLNIFPRPGTVPFTTIHPLDIERYEETGDWPVGACNDFRRRFGGSVDDIHDECARGFVTGAHGADPDMATQTTNTGRRILVPKSRRCATPVEDPEEKTPVNTTETAGHDQSTDETPQVFSVETHVEQQTVQVIPASDTTSKTESVRSSKKKNKTNKGMSKKQRAKAKKAATTTAATATAATATDATATTVLTSVALTPTTSATQPFTGPTSQASLSSFGAFNSQTGVAVPSNGPAWFAGNRAERRRRRFGTGGLQTPLQQAEASSSDYAHLSEEAGEAGADTTPDLHTGNPLTHVQASMPSPPPSSPLDSKVVEKQRSTDVAVLQLADPFDDSLSRPPPPLLSSSFHQQRVIGNAGPPAVSGGLPSPPAPSCKSFGSPLTSDNKENVPPNITGGGADSTIFVEQQPPILDHDPSRPAQLSDGGAGRHASDTDDSSNGGDHDKGSLVAQEAMDPEDSEPETLELWRSLLREGRAIEQKNQYL